MDGHSEVPHRDLLWLISDNGFRNSNSVPLSRADLAVRGSNAGNFSRSPALVPALGFYVPLRRNNTANLRTSIRVHSAVNTSLGPDGPDRALLNLSSLGHRGVQHHLSYNKHQTESEKTENNLTEYQQSRVPCCSNKETSTKKSHSSIVQRSASYPAPFSRAPRSRLRRTCWTARCTQSL
jgi:hypothetical protein